MGENGPPESAGRRGRGMSAKRRTGAAARARNAEAWSRALSFVSPVVLAWGAESRGAPPGKKQGWRIFEHVDTLPPQLIGWIGLGEPALQARPPPSTRVDGR